MSPRNVRVPAITWPLLALTFAIASMRWLTRTRPAASAAVTQHPEDLDEAVKAGEQRFRALVHHASDLITIVEGDGTVTYQSPSVVRMLGFSADNIVGRKLDDLVHTEDLPALRDFMTDVSGKYDDVSSVALRLKTLDGAWRDTELAGTDRRRDAAVRGIVLNIRDISDRVALESHIRFHASHDALTGLANRAHLSERLQLLLDHPGDDTHVAVLALAVDDFASTAESLGQDAADAIVVEVGARLRAVTRAEDTVARLGADQFAVLFEDLADPAQSREAATRILATISTPLRLDGVEIAIRASGGLAVPASNAGNANTILRDADLALYEAKASKTTQLAEFHPAMREAAADRLTLLRDLDRALERDELLLEYQPTVELATGKLVGVEALVRWQHPTRGLLQPDSFISLAEESGRILEIGAYVLRTACKQAGRWKEEFRHTQLAINVNVSVRQLLEPGFVDIVTSALGGANFDPHCLVLEITESVMMDNQRSTKTALRELKDIGVKLAIDDFGTGYSSLRYLHEFPFDIIKIDRSFLADDRRAQSDRELERAIVTLGRTLKLEVIAEGIETGEQLDRLRSLDCEFGQGYYFARPMPPARITTLLRGDTRLAVAA